MFDNDNVFPILTVLISAKVDEPLANVRVPPPPPVTSTLTSPLPLFVTATAPVNIILSTAFTVVVLSVTVKDEPNDDVDTNCVLLPAPPTQIYPCDNDAVKVDDIFREPVICKEPVITALPV